MHYKMITEEDMGQLCLGRRYKPFGAPLPTAPLTDIKDGKKKSFKNAVPELWGHRWPWNATHPLKKRPWNEQQ